MIPKIIQVRSLSLMHNPSLQGCKQIHLEIVEKAYSQSPPYTISTPRPSSYPLLGPRVPTIRDHISPIKGTRKVLATSRKHASPSTKHSVKPGFSSGAPPAGMPPMGAQPSPGMPGPPGPAIETFVEAGD